jgi:hypothetical protein
MLHSVPLASGGDNFRSIRPNMALNGVVACSSPRVPALAVVNTPPPISAMASRTVLCEGESTILSVFSPNDPNYTYEWTPGNLPGTGITVIPTVSANYEVVATDNSGGMYDGCVNTASVMVTVNPVPTPITVTPDQAVVCSGEITELVLSGGLEFLSGTIGTGTTTTTVSTPYKGAYGGVKVHLLYSASDLTAMGMLPGAIINSATFNISSFTSPYTYKDFTILMKNTTSSFVSTTLETGLTEVLPPFDFILAGTAPFSATHALATPFVWDGVSNLLVETCFNNNDGGVTGKSASVVSTSTSPNYLCAYFHGDNNPNVCSAPGTATITYTRPNIGLDFGNPASYEWMPQAGLYTDAGATVPYAGESLTTVYAMPATSETYTVTGTNMYNCWQSATAGITVHPLYITDVEKTDIDCYGNINGSITIITSGGAGQLLFSIDDGATWNTTNVFSGLMAGTYHVVVKDTVCTVYWGFNPVVINEPSELLLHGVSVTDISCHGLNDGSILISATGGTAPIEYSIDNGLNWQLNNAFMNLPAGIHNILIKDSNNCQVIWAANPEAIVDPPALVIDSVIVNDITCFGNDDGNISVYASGGTGTLWYSIDSGASWQASGIFDDLLAGTGYNVLVKDDNNCQVACMNNPLAILEPPLLVLDSVTFTEATICGVGDGTATIYTAGGTAPLSYSVDNGLTWQASNFFGTLLPGYYNIVVKDANDCEVVYANNPIEILGPQSIDILSVAVTSLVCFGDNDGEIVITASGGTGDIEYSIDNGANYVLTNVFTGLPGGVYHIRLRDSIGCEVPYTGNPVNLHEPAELVIGSVTVSQISCNNAHDGYIIINVTGGTGTIQYSINDGLTWGTLNAFTGLVAGSYNIKVKDANGCETMYGSNPVVIVNPPAVVLGSVIYDDISCHGANDGMVIITASGGSSPLFYSVDDGNFWQTSGIFVGLAPGSYDVKVADAHGCAVSYPSNPIVIVEPTPVVITDVLSTQITCNGANDGSISITASGGTGTLQYSINYGASWQASGNFTNLPAGTYYVKVKDAVDCEVLYSGNPIVIAQPPAILITNVVSAHINCHGANTGTINISASGGLGGLMYSINNGTTWQSSPLFTNLTPGSYIVKVKDAGQCIASYLLNPVVITQPPQLVIGNVIVNQITCNGGGNGGITIAASGGSGMVYYSINNGLNYYTSNTFSNLPAGNYNVKVLDGNGCVTTYGSNPIVISNPPVITVSAINSTHVKCKGIHDGTITLMATGGSGALQYSINDGATWQASNVFTGLAAGTYLWKVKDAHNCMTNYPFNQVTITEPATALSVMSVTATPSSCSGGTDGTITIGAGGGTGFIYYSINNGQTYQVSSVFTGVPAGSYTIKVKDFNDCVATYPSNPVIVGQPTAAAITVSAVSNASCFGGSDGSIALNVAGATPPYMVSGNNGSTWQAGTTITGLNAGSHTVLVKDANNCTFPYIANPVVIGQAPAINIVEVETQAADCFGVPTGTITVTASGGTGTLMYSADNGVSWSSSNVLYVTGGYHNVIVRDGNNCIEDYDQNPVFIYAPDPILYSAVNVSNISCNGNTDGSITILAYGGIGALQYSIDGGSTWHANYIFNNLIAGTYAVMAMDITNCTQAYAGNPVVIVDPDVLSIDDVEAMDVTCFGLADGQITIDLTGGTMPYEYSIDNGSTWAQAHMFTGLTPGNYQIQARDVNMCQTMYGSNPVAIAQPAQLVITQVAQGDITTVGGSDGFITVTVTGGTGILLYSIDDGASWLDNGGAFTGLTIGSYHVWVADENGCETEYADNPVVLTDPTGISDADRNYSFNVFPNPTSGEVMIVAAGMEQVSKIEILGFEGRVIDVLQFNQPNTDELRVPYSFSGYAKGVYFIRLFEEGKVHLIRVAVN